MRVGHISEHPLRQLRRWMRDPLAFMEAARDVGDLVRVQVGGFGFWLLLHPELVEHVLVRNTRNYGKQTRGYRAMRLVAGQGLVTSEGEVWKRQRRIINPAFHRKSIAAMTGEMAAQAELLAERWVSIARAGRVHDVAHDMMEVTLRIACRTFFSMDLEGGGVERIAAASEACLDPFVFYMSAPVAHPERLPLRRNRRFWRGVRTLDSEIAAMVRARRASAEHPHDLLSLLLAAVDDETGKAMSDTQLRDELITMLVAGHETTANGLAWTLYLLSRNPTVLDRVQRELDEVVGDAPLTIEVLDRLPFLAATWSEGLRLYPPAWSHARSALEADTLAGTAIAPGDITIAPQWPIHRDPRWWPDPLRFDPDRFAPGQESTRPKFAWFPFSGGSRKCIGDRFGTLEALFILAALLRRVDLEATPHVPEPLPTVTLRARDGIHLRLRSR